MECGTRIPSEVRRNTTPVIASRRHTTHRKHGMEIDSDDDVRVSRGRARVVDSDDDVAMKVDAKDKRAGGMAGAPEAGSSKAQGAADNYELPWWVLWEVPRGHIPTTPDRCHAGSKSTGQSISETLWETRKLFKDCRSLPRTVICPTSSFRWVETERSQHTCPGCAEPPACDPRARLVSVKPRVFCVWPTSCWEIPTGTPSLNSMPRMIGALT